MEVAMTVPAVVPAEVPMLDLDRLDVYRAAVQFCAVVSRLRVTPASLRDQIDRASASVVLTLAEGVGRVSGPDRAFLCHGARERSGMRGRARSPACAWCADQIRSPRRSHASRPRGPDADAVDRSAAQRGRSSPHAMTRGRGYERA
jgi:hypothetical protein